MLPVEEIIRMDREAEEKRKNAALRQKKRKFRMKFSFFSTIGFFVFVFSPIGLPIVADFSQPRAAESNFFLKILQKSADILWVYGYLEESFNYYKFLHDNISENNNLKCVQDAFYNMALTQYHLQQLKTSIFLYRIYKIRWPQSDQERLNQIDKRLGIMSVVNPSNLGLKPPQWVYDLADKHGLEYTN